MNATKIAIFVCIIVSILYTSISNQITHSIPEPDIPTETVEVEPEPIHHTPLELYKNDDSMKLLPLSSIHPRLQEVAFYDSLTINEFVCIHQGKIKYEPRHYDDWADDGTEDVVFIAYGLMPSYGNYHQRICWPLSQDSTFLEDKIRPLFQHEYLRQLFFDTFKDSYINTLKSMDDDEIVVYKKIFQHAENYILNFDLDSELDWYLHHPEIFAYYKPGKVKEEYRKIEAFMARRLFELWITLPDAQRWMIKINKLVQKIDKYK